MPFYRVAAGSYAPQTIGFGPNGAPIDVAGYATGGVSYPHMPYILEYGRIITFGPYIDLIRPWQGEQDVPASGSTPVSDTDAGVGTEASLLTITDADSGAGVDAVGNRVIVASDAGSGVDTPALTAVMSSVDTNGTTTETGAVSVPISGTDSGAGVDDVQSLKSVYGDTGSGSEAPNIVYTIGDTGAGADSPNIVYYMAESGAGTDAIGSQVRSALDTGTDTETPTLAASMTTSDSGAGTDTESKTVGGATPVNSSDSGSGTDTPTISAVMSISESNSTVENAAIAELISDSGSGTDTPTPKATNSAADSGAGTDTNTLGVVTQTQIDFITISSHGVGVDVEFMTALYQITDPGSSTDTMAAYKANYLISENVATVDAYLIVQIGVIMGAAPPSGGLIGGGSGVVESGRGPGRLKR